MKNVKNSSFFFQNSLTPGFFLPKLLNSRFFRFTCKMATLSVIDLNLSKVEKITCFYTWILLKNVSRNTTYWTFINKCLYTIKKLQLLKLVIMELDIF